jgi:hypothetical protein
MPSTAKYKNALCQLATFCEPYGLDYLDELGTEELDAFRAPRTIGLITSAKELEILRVFLGFCMDRGWVGKTWRSGSACHAT